MVQEHAPLSSISFSPLKSTRFHHRRHHYHFCLLRLFVAVVLVQLDWFHLFSGKMEMGPKRFVKRIEVIISLIMIIAMRNDADVWI